MKTVHVDVEESRSDEFLELVQAFMNGTARLLPKAMLADAPYHVTVERVTRDAATSYKLRQRIGEDRERDPVDALTDAELLHALASRRFTEVAPDWKEPARETIVRNGVDALKRLYEVALGNSGQCRYVARLLLGLYNGSRFPFDLTNLRALDDDLFEDCLTLLQMDARAPMREVQMYFADGGSKWEALALQHRVVDAEVVRNRAERLAEASSGGREIEALAAALIEALNADR